MACIGRKVEPSVLWEIADTVTELLDNYENRKGYISIFREKIDLLRQKMLPDLPGKIRSYYVVS